MYTLVILSVLVLAASAATPFFESPDNPRAAPFYKVPVNHDYPSSSYQSRPSAPYNPYKQGESDFYKPQPSFYNQEPSFYKPQSYQPSYGGQGSSSYQTVRLGGGHQGYSQYRPRY